MFTLVVTWPVSCFYVFRSLVSTEIVLQHRNVLSVYHGSWSSEKTINMISYKVKSHIWLILSFPLWFPSNVQIDPTAAGAVYDREFIVCSLDLLSGLAEGLGAGIESLVSYSLWIWYPFPFQVHFRHDHMNTPLTYPHGCVRGRIKLFSHWVQSYYHIGAML